MTTNPNYCPMIYHLHPNPKARYLFCRAHSSNLPPLFPAQAQLPVVLVTIASSSWFYQEIPMERRTPAKLSRLCPVSSPAATPPPTPGFTGPRRSSRLLTLSPGPTKPCNDASSSPITLTSPTKAKRRLSLESSSTDPITPSRSESKRPKRRVNCKKVLYGGAEFQVFSHPENPYSKYDLLDNNLTKLLGHYLQMWKSNHLI